jgi:hypothetical protein
VSGDERIEPTGAAREPTEAQALPDAVSQESTTEGHPPRPTSSGPAQVIRRTDLRVAAAALAWLVGTLWGLLNIRPVWVVVAIAAAALAAGVIRGAEFRRGVIVLVVIFVIGLGATASFVEDALSGAEPAPTIPPTGTVIDAQTGEPAMNVQHSTPQVAQIGAGGIFRACDLTREHPCRYERNQGPIKARPGDLLELGIRLHNGNDASVPYARFTVEMWGGNGTFTERDSHGNVISEGRDPLSAKLDIEYRTGTTDEGIEESVEIDVPESAGYTALNYVPGSTFLLDRHHHLVGRLPDGIMDSGLALADIGSPSSCYFCDIRYTRFIFFKARVNDGAP